MKLSSALAAATLASLALAVTPAQAAILYWDGTTSTANADGGNGTWDTSTTNWDTAALAGSDTVWTNTPPDFAVFGGTVGTLNVVVS